MWIQKVPGGGVSHLAYSPDGRLLYTLDNGGWLTAWDVATHAGLRIAHGQWSRAFFPRGLYPLADGRLLIRTASFFLCDAASEPRNSPAPTGLGHHDYAQIRADGRVYYLGSTKTIFLWDLAADRPKLAFTLPETVG